MKNSTFGLGRRIAVALGALALTATGAAGAAYADETPVNNPGNINSSTPTSLTIHKHSGAQGTAGDGTEQSVTNPAVEGVTFTIQKVAKKGNDLIDLDTSAGWDLIKDVKASDVTGDGFTLEDTTSGTTNAKGLISKKLDHGLYLVTETNAPANVVSKSAPFLVTLPLPQGNGGWLYDVHTYPKNQLQDKPEKEVSNPDGPVLGSQITWTVTSKVPALNNGDSFKKYVITDQLDSRLGYVSATLSGFDSSDYTATEKDGLVTITLTSSGLAKLKTGDTITAKIVTTIDALGEGTIENTALVNTNDSKQESTTPKTYWGNLQVTKVAKNDHDKVLKGAEFAVYSDSDATKKIGEFTTDSEGRANITLWAGKDNAGVDYWVKETKAPAGFILDDTVHKVTVKAGKKASTELTVENTQQSHPSLPLTGANGQLMAILVGSALVLLAAGSAIVVNRRRKAQH